MADLSLTVNGLRLPNPFVIGSGPPGTNANVISKAFDEGWGAVIALACCSRPLPVCDGGISSPPSAVRKRRGSFSPTPRHPPRMCR